MVEEPKRTLAYLCPECRQPVLAEKTVFSLAAGPSSVPCPCGKSALKIDMLGDHVNLTVPCLLCEKEHSVSCSTHAFLHEKALAFACAASGLDCCYVGEEGAVFAAMRRLEETVDKLEASAGAEGTFLDDIIMHEVLSELRDIAQRGGACPRSRSAISRSAGRGRSCTCIPAFRTAPTMSVARGPREKPDLRPH